MPSNLVKSKEEATSYPKSAEWSPDSYSFCSYSSLKLRKILWGFWQGSGTERVNQVPTKSLGNSRFWVSLFHTPR